MPGLETDAPVALFPLPCAEVLAVLPVEGPCPIWAAAAFVVPLP